jgi:membrane-associated protease RseP (regulator of RpoE activity)
MQVLGIVLFAVSIILVILIHEAAHYGVAKAFRIKVEEFFLGFGPRLWSFRRGETEYGVKALPLGGYVKIAGMNPYVEPTPEEYPRTFGAKPIWQRALVIVAGPFTHFVIAFLLFVAFFALIGIDRYRPLVGEVDSTINGEPSPAVQVGLQEGDVVVAMDGTEDPSSTEFLEFTRQHEGRPMRMTVDRDGRELSFEVTPVLDREFGVARLGITLDSGEFLGRQRFGPLASITEGAETFGATTVEVFRGIGRAFGPEGLGRLFTLLFTGEERQVTDPATVVGVARAAGELGLPLLVPLIAGVNMFVGFLNLLPLLPFDGGHLAVLGVEKVRGRKVDMRRLMPVTAVVAAFLIIFMLSVLYLDIVKPIQF